MPDVTIVIVAIIFGGAFGVAIIAIIAEAIQKVLQTRAREQTKREIAAYIAEGSISPEDGMRLVEAQGGSWKIKDMFKGGCG